MSVTHQIIKYRLNPDGTIPDFLCREGMGGIFLKYDPLTPSPQDHIMFGLSEYEVTEQTSGIVGIITSKDELTAYLTDVLDGQYEIVFDNSTGENVQIPIDATEKSDWAWQIYCDKNGISTT